MDIIDISELRKKHQEKIKEQDLSTYVETQHSLIENLCIQIETLKEKNVQLENLLKRSYAPSISQEELICLEQIDILKNRSSQRELTTDEVKKMDILIKNIRLIREESTIVMSSKNLRNISNDDLIAIASSSSEE